jgi:PAS domain S-box-containing protein
MAESPTAETSLIIGSKEEAPIRVLHVDDDAGFLETAQQILELQGSFQVETASSVDEAFELVKEKVYDVIVSDFQMPGKDGLQFLRKLRGAGNPTPFVMFTGRGREAVAIQALNLGADQYVNKTGDPATVYGELAHAIDHAVQTRRARERLRRSEASYRSLVEEAGAGILTVDPQGVFTYVNEELGNILGFSRRELLGKPFADFIHPDDKQRILQIFASFMKNPDVKPRFEFRAIHKRGYTLHLHSAPTRLTYEGEVVGSYAIVTDVTEREKAEKERDKLLRDYGARVKELRCLYEIANLVETPNISLEEILQGTSDLLPAAWRYPDVTCARIVFENHEFKTKNFRETKWKQQSDVNVHGKKAGAVEVYYLEDKPPAADGPFLIEERSLIDAVAERLGRIIERMKAQEAMAASRKRLDDILDAIPDSVCVTNLDGNITLANEAMTGLFGLSRDKFLTMKGRDLAAEEDQAQIFKAMQNVIQTGRPQDVQTTGRLGGAEGRSFWIRFSTLKNEKGEPAGFVTITRDVTEQKEREKNLKQSEEKYRDIVELAPDGIATVNMKGVVTSVNDCFLKLTGYSSDEIVGKRFTKLGTIRKRDMPRLLKLFTSMVR